MIFRSRLSKADVELGRRVRLTKKQQGRPSLAQEDRPHFGRDASDMEKSIQNPDN